MKIYLNWVVVGLATLKRRATRPLFTRRDHGYDHDPFQSGKGNSRNPNLVDNDFVDAIDYYQGILWKIGG